ncbi:MAG: CRISPR-associated helicase Cas3', partial [Hydrogenophaga sp.]|nr:CRISPR-associated helicase Cas3' [Hydrogenophaga sp.]
MSEPKAQAGGSLLAVDTAWGKLNRPIAHAPELPGQVAHWLDEHLLAVGALARGFAEPFGPDWADLAGIWHDLGKYRLGFQRYLAQSNNPDGHIEGRVSGREKTHSAAGALWAIQQLGKPLGHVLAYLIAGHHAGLDDWDSGLNERLKNADSQEELKSALAGQPPEHILQGNTVPLDLRQIPGGSAGFALWVRMLFSCLVDADFLDTEAYFDAGKPARRRGFPDLEQMLSALNVYMNAKAASAPVTPVNTLRADILRQCRAKALLEPGFFTLTVPTGGGKTLSSLAFALEHAKTHGQRRIIYAIPYTSIIEQTAEVFRGVFAALGDEVLIEHHSQADAPSTTETARSRLACDNWDAPLVVTTNVQLFESLFAAKTSRCRKLHNLVGSVIVLDEAQQLPAAFLNPILGMLKLLVKHYGVTVVLCTATQPALARTNYFDPSRNVDGLDNVREITDDPDHLYRQLDRVQVELPNDWHTPTPWADVAERLKQEDCALIIVNTRKAARELYRLLPEGTLHLSALMCGAHRKAVIDQIKARLRAKRESADTQSLRVVSTQLVEAGVDLDFPLVYRALAGLDSIAQAAGRCNREGLLQDAQGQICKGRVVVFVPPDKLPAGQMRKAADACTSVLHGQTSDPLARGLFERYFQQFYHSVNLDEKGIAAMLKVDDRKTLAVQFRSAAEAFKLIDDADQATVVVRYAPHREELAQWLALLERDGPQRWLMRKLQRHTVTIR